MKNDHSSVLPAIIILLLLLSFAYPVYTTQLKSQLPVEITTSPENTEYLRGVMKETLDSILYYRNPVTGFPSYVPENPNNQEVIKTEHIFLVFTSIAIAGKIGLIPEKAAEKELLKILDWIEKIPTSDGFFMDMIHTADASAGNNELYPAADYGFNPCGLIVVAEAYPNLKKRALKLVNATSWSKIYNKSEGYVGGMLHIKPGNPIRADGSLLFLAMDMRMAIFLSIASEGAPADLWNRMPRYYQERYGIKYLKPGEALGYGEQTWALGYFLDERGSELGMSDANMAWGQILYAKDMDYPLWGWSNCLTPSGYQGFGDPGTSWSVINPHAIAAAVPFYPNQVVKALRTLEKLGGREPININGKKYNFGFRGSVDIDTKTSAGGMIPGLDQAIIFLSLANYLHNGIVWKYFAQNETVRRGKQLIPDYDNQKTEYLELYKKRDKEGSGLIGKDGTASLKPIVIDSFNSDGEKNDLGGSRSPYNAEIKINNGICAIKFDSTDEKSTSFKEMLADSDITFHKAIKFSIRGKTGGKILLSLKISGEGGYRTISVTPAWHEIILPLRSLLGGKDGFDYGRVNVDYKWTAMWHDRTRAEELSISPISVSEVELKELSFINLSTEEINAAAAKIADDTTSLIDNEGTFDQMTSVAEWKVLTSDGDVRANLSIVPGYKGNCIACDYSFGPKGGWIALIRSTSFNLRDKNKFSLFLKSEGGPANCDLKLTEPGGAVYIKQLPDALSKTGWQEIEAPINQFKYGWGGERKDNPQKMTQLEFSISDSKASSGKVYLDELKIK